MKIAAVISDLRDGGAQRVLTTLCDGWRRLGHEVTLITMARVDDWFPLDPAIHRIGLDLTRPSRSPVHGMLAGGRRIRALRAALRAVEPDVVVSFGTQVNVLALWATAGLGCPVAISERVHPPRHPMGWIWSLLRRVSYRRAWRVIVQTERTRVWAAKLVPPDRVVVLPNPIHPRFLGQATASPRRPMVLAMGRLTPQKGFDILIDAFARVAARHPGWSLVVVGVGPERDVLEDRSRRSVSPGRVDFIDRVDDPERLLEAAAIYVLSSRYEGFPNSLLEAMACGCSVIAADCETGPAEIVRHEVNGLLVPTEGTEAMAEALDRLMSEPETRRSFGTEARKVREAFSPDRIVRRWAATLQDAAPAGDPG